MHKLIEIAGDLPPTLNEQIKDARTHYAISAKSKKKWTDYVANLAATHTPFDKKDLIWVEYHWFLKSFARDSDNVAASAKYINDGIVDAGLIRNDNLTVIQSPVVHYYHRDSCDRFLVRLANTPDLLDGKIIDDIC